jgi:uncharacterized protein DUF6603
VAVSDGFFVTTYGQRYPAVLQSTLGDLVFSQHTLSQEGAFSGNLVLASSYLQTLSKMLRLQTLLLSGTVREADGQLSVTLSLADAGPALTGLAGRVPMLAAVDVTLRTIVDRTVAPKVDEFILTVTLKLRDIPVKLTTNVPLEPANIAFHGKFSGVTIAPGDFDGLLGGADKWFPHGAVAPLGGDKPRFELLSLDLYFADTTLDDFKLSLGAIGVALGIGHIPLMPDRLYIDPLSVGVMIGVPVAGAPIVTLGGRLVLCSHERPGNTAHPSLALALSVTIPDLALSAAVENPETTPLAVVLRDLVSPDHDISIGLPEKLALTHARIGAQFDRTTHGIASFSASLGMSGGFGLLADLDLDPIEIAVAYGMNRLAFSFACGLRVGDQVVPLKTEYARGTGAAQTGVQNGFLFKLDRGSDDSAARVNLGDLIGLIESEFKAGDGQLANKQGVAVVQQAMPSVGGFSRDNQAELEIQSFQFNSTSDAMLFAISVDVVGSDPKLGVFALPPVLAKWLRIDRLAIAFSALKRVALASTDVEVALGLNFTIGTVPVALAATLQRSASGTVYTFDGSVQDATVELGDFLRTAVEQFGGTASLPPEIDLKAVINYVAGRVVHSKPAQGATKTELSVAGAFTLTAAHRDSVRIAFYADTVQGGGTDAPYVLGAAFDVDLPLSKLPLLGSISGLNKLTLTSLGFSYASAATSATPTPFAIPRVTSAPNPLVTPGEPGARNATSYAIDPAGTARDLQLASPGFSLTVGLTDSGTLVKNFAMPLGGSTQSRPTGPLTGTAGSSTQDPIHWIELNKTFGPVSLKKIGLNYAQGEASFGLSAGLSLAAFALDVQGLAITFPLPLPGQPAGKTVSFDLAGLALDIRRAGFEVGGGFLRVPQDGGDAYFGEVAVQIATFGLKAVGGYLPARGNDHPASFFLYARLTAPLGGPPFLFITGLAAGFGVHSALVLPTIETISNYALLPGNAPVPAEGASPGDAVQAVISQIGNGKVFRYDPGEYWIAVGISFTSFEMIDAFALATVGFGVELQVGLLGSCSMSLPKGAPGMLIAYVEVDIVASFTPSTGLIAVAGKLSPASFLYGGFVHLTGGFAFYTWVSGPDKGDFVVSLGGYHPAFRRPPQYPPVPRLGLQFVLGPLQVTGESYFALTPAMMMAGIALHASWSSGGVRAWLDASVDMLVVWSPFRYEAQAALSIGCSIDLGLLQLNIHLGALLHVWGPEFGGMAEIDLEIASFVINFGAARVPPKPIGWNTFCTSFLPKPTEAKQPATRQRLRAARAHAVGGPRARLAVTKPDAPTVQNVVTASVAKGLISAETHGLEWIVDADAFSIVTSSAIPANQAEWKRVRDTVSLPNDVPTWRSGALPAVPRLSLALIPDFHGFSATQVWNPNVSIRPMHLLGVTAYHTLSLRAVDNKDNKTLIDVDAVQITPLTGLVAAALYAPSTARQDANELATVPNALTGFRIAPERRHPARVSTVPLSELLFGLGENSRFADGAPHLDTRCQVAATHPRPEELDITLSGAHAGQLVNKGFVLNALADEWVATQRKALVGDLHAAGLVDDKADDLDLATFSKETTLTGWPAVARLADHLATEAP